MPVQEIITVETRDNLKRIVDEMCGLLVDLNSYNYEQFMNARDNFINCIDDLTLAE